MLGDLLLRMACLRKTGAKIGLYFHRCNRIIPFLQAFLKPVLQSKTIGYALYAMQVGAGLHVLIHQRQVG